MASRPKRGKFMPVNLSQQQHDSGSDSSGDSETSDDSIRSTNEENEEKKVSKNEEREENEENEENEEDEDMALVEGELIGREAAAALALKRLNQQQLRLQQRQEQAQKQKNAEKETEEADEEEEEDDDDDDDDDEEDEDDEDDEEDDEEEGGGGDVEEEDGSDGDEEEEDFRPPPTPRVVASTINRKRHLEREEPPLDVRDPQNVSEIYSDLIEDCQSLEADTGFDENFQAVMSRNIQKGHALFEHLMKGATSNDGEKRTRGGLRDLCRAFYFTKISSNIIRSKAERIGSGASIFSVEGFLGTLKKEFIDSNDGIRDYSAKLAAANIAMQTSTGIKTLMPLVAVVGTFDRDAKVVPKPKKPRAPIRRPNAEEQQDNAADDNADNMQLVQQNPGAENSAKEMNKILKHVHRHNADPVNLYEFVMDRTSFPKTIENIFNLSFLVKDGHVSITKEENGKFKDLSLTLKPEKSQIFELSSPDEGETSRNQTHRQKYILSFNPRMWKDMCNMAQGNDEITFYQQSVEKQQHSAAFPSLKFT